MANINTQLKDYLSKSSNSSIPGSDINTSSASSFSLPFFKSNESSNSDATANGWFSEAQKDPFLPSLTKKQRIMGFIVCLLMGTFCFSLASLYIPLLVLKARKFAMLYTLGSLFVIASFSLLWGPMNHMKHLFSAQRLPFTTAYFGTMFGTVYFAVWLQSTVLTVIFAVAQILTLLWYVVSYIPGGNTGLKFFTKIFYATASKTVSKTLPV